MFRAVRNVVITLAAGLVCGSAGAATDADAGTSPARDAWLRDLRAVEAVYWDARLWPEANPTPKPDVDSVFPESAAAARLSRIRTTLDLLASRWDVRLDARDVQRELDRIAASTKSPARLRALFAALDHDAERIARALVLPRLAERVADRLVASDRELQADARARAHDLARTFAPPGRSPDEALPVEEVVYVRQGAQGVLDPARAESAEVLDDAAWATLAGDLARRFPAPRAGGPGPRPDSVAEPRASVRETRRGFVIEALVERTASSIVLGRRVVPKRTLASVLEDAALVSVNSGDAPMPAAAVADVATLRLPVLDATRADFGAADCTDDTWQDYFVEPSARSAHTAVWTGAEMIVWGGYNDHETYDDGGIYDPVTDSWTPVTRVGAPAGRSEQTAVWTGTEMIVWGGYNDSTNGLGTGGRYNPTTDSWTAVTTTGAPGGRTRHVAVWTGTEMIVWGGSDSAGASGPGGRYAPATDAWMLMPPFAGPDVRDWATAVWTGSQMLVFGGGPESASFPGDLYGDTWAYTPGTNAWTPRSAVPGEPRTRHTAVWTGTQMIVWGGQGLVYDPESDEYVATNLGDGWRYTPSTNTWTAVGTTGAVPEPRYLHTAVWSGTQMIVYGGYGGFDAGAYNPTTNTWSYVTRVGSPGGFYEIVEHSAVWAGTRMIVWGGITSVGVVSEGARYTPGTDTWTPTSDSGAPRTRAEHKAVWTGAEMIVHGGRTIEPTTTYRYDPALDAWSVTAPSALTGALILHTAVWSGTEMIVWGGLALPSTNAGDGGRYNPTTNTWTPGSSTGAPTPRYRHVAGWNGAEMIVWGGTSNDTTGGRYNPATNSWTATSTANAPSARSHPVAVVTPTTFIVWGGYSGSGNLGTGGRYDWATNTWTPTATTGAPAPRQRHTAVWTGTEMIVWGGTTPTSGTGVNDGARYEPNSDTWTPTSLVGAPEPRGEHVAVWTGTEMIVWGGTRTFQLASGGRYDPQANAWSPTSLDGGPCARKSHTAVWSGTEMLVFGGDVFNRVPIGGRYCAASACVPSTWYLDADGDGRGDAGSTTSACEAPQGYVAGAGDCDDADPAAWATPGEARELALAHDVPSGITTLTWLAPEAPGSPPAALLHDVLRAGTPQGFDAGTCVASGAAGETAPDPASPSAGAAFHYLVRALNGCPQADGALGTTSAGAPRSGRACP